MNKRKSSEQYGYNMVNINPILSAITLKINSLNTPIKSQRFPSG